MPFFLFTDIEGSTGLWESFPQDMPEILRRHDQILKEELSRYGGRIIDHMGDGVYAVFEEESRPLQSLIQIQIRLAQGDWGEIGPLKVRMGLNARTADKVGVDYFKERHDYFGPAINHTSRLMNVAWGGQILLTADALEQDEVPAGATIVDLGQHILRNLSQPQQIYSLEHPDMLQRAFPPLRTLSSRPNNVPSPTTIFIGREQELEKIDQLLMDPQCRLLTLVGPGGMGKTRLSMAAAAYQLDKAAEDDRFANGIYFIPLAPLTAVDQIAPAIAEVLLFSFYENSPPKKQLFDYLHHKKMLLILDNFEHLVQGADLLSELLAQSPGLTLLVTSRERLNLNGEWTLTVAGMGYPATDTGALRENFESYTAVQLFLNGIQRFNPGFVMTEADKPAIAQICRLLDGLPLGLELAASWTRVLSCQEIANEISTSLDFLSSNLRDRPERHHSLNAVFDHSWRLLSEQEQTVFKKLSVFCSAFNLNAGQTVSGASLPQMMALNDKSLIKQAESGQYEVHSTLRQYLSKRLDQDPTEKAAVEISYSKYFAEFVEQQRNRLRGPMQKAALFEIAREIENIRAGWQFALSYRLDTTIEKYLDSLYNFYWIRGWNQQGAATFRDAVTALTETRGAGQQGDQSSAVLLARIMARQGAYNYRLGLPENAGRLLKESLNIFQRFNVIDEMGYVFTFLGATAYLQGDNDAAEQLLQQGLSYAQTTRSQIGTTIAYHHLGLVALARSDYGTARLYHQHSLDMAQTLGEPFGTAMALNNLGVVSYHLGQFDEARDLQRRSLALRREINDQWGIATTLNSMALVAYSQDKYEQARQLLSESLNLFREVGDKKNTAVTLRDLSVVADTLNQPEEAERLRAESLETFSSSGRRQANVTTISSIY